MNFIVYVLDTTKVGLNYVMLHRCYYQLRQLCVMSRSLTSTATATLVHAFVTFWLDYCSTLYAGLPAVHLGCLEQVIRTAARLIGGIPRTGHVSTYMLDVLHWLPLQQRIMFRIGAMVWRCILGLAPGQPPRSLLYHPGHQRSQFTPLIGTGVTLCSFCSCIHNPGPCILGGWPFCVEWASFAAKIAPQDSF